MNITINIDNSTVKDIKSIYGNDNYETINIIVQDIIERYLSVEYFDPSIQIEQNEEDSNNLDLFILNELKETISQIIINNGYNESLFNAKLFENAVEKKSFLITEYEIGRIYTLAEIYFKIMQKPNYYSDIVEIIVGYDTQTDQ